MYLNRKYKQTQNCTSSLSCGSQSIQCPFNHSCTINCNSPSSCQNTTIHAENSTLLSIFIASTTMMTIYSPYSSDRPLSSITCQSAACLNLEIYSLRGFDDIILKCADNSSSCNITGAMQCGYDSYYNDICTSFQYINDEIGYLCSDSTFCQLSTSFHPTHSPTKSPSQIIISRHTLIPETTMLSTSGLFAFEFQINSTL